jgi:hypothetical protein
MNGTKVIKKNWQHWLPAPTFKWFTTFWGHCNYNQEVKEKIRPILNQSVVTDCSRILYLQLGILHWDPHWWYVWFNKYRMVKNGKITVNKWSSWVHAIPQPQRASYNRFLQWMLNCASENQSPYFNVLYTSYFFDWLFKFL